MPFNVDARDRFTIRCGGTVFGEYDTFDCRIAVESNFNFNQIEFEIVTSDGVEISSIRSNHQALWEVNINNDGSGSATVRQNRMVNGLQEFGIVLFRSNMAGAQEIEITNIVLTNTNNNQTREITGATQEIRILSSDNRLENIMINGNPIARFMPNISRYHLEIPIDATEIYIEATPLDVQATITGIGNVSLDLDQNYFVLPIVVKSATDINRVYILHVRREGTRLPTVTASNIELLNNGSPVNFGFRAGTFEYDIEVPSYMRVLDINVELENEGYSLMPNFGTRRVNLDYGDNIVLVKIMNDEGERSVYAINIRRVVAHKSENNFLQEINVERHRLNERFNRRVRQYTISLRRSVTELEIEAIPEHRNATIAITGNENLQDGSIIRIIVTAENGSTRVYEITITNQTFGILQIAGIIVLSLSGLLIYRHIKKPVSKEESEAMNEEVIKATESIKPVELPEETIELPIEMPKKKGVVAKKAAPKKKVVGIKKATKEKEVEIPKTKTNTTKKKKVVKITKPEVKEKVVTKKPATKKAAPKKKTATKTTKGKTTPKRKTNTRKKPTNKKAAPKKKTN